MAVMASMERQATKLFGAVDCKSDVDRCLLLYYHRDQFLRQPLYGNKVMTGAFITTRYHLITSFRRHAKLMMDKDDDPNDILVLSSYADQLVYHPIIAICRTHESLFPGAQHVTMEQIGERMNEEPSIHDIVASTCPRLAWLGNSVLEQCR